MNYIPVTCSRRLEKKFLEACTVTCCTRSKQLFVENASINNNEGGVWIASECGLKVGEE